jgi:uncharacterized membrane protein YtjA (UPF0391 family)
MLEAPMMRWLMALLVLGTIAFVFGFTNIFGDSMGMARTLFFVYAGFGAATLVVGIIRR